MEEGSTEGEDSSREGLASSSVSLVTILDTKEKQENLQQVLTQVQSTKNITNFLKRNDLKSFPGKS